MNEWAALRAEQDQSAWWAIVRFLRSDLYRLAAPTEYLGGAGDPPTNTYENPGPFRVRVGGTHECAAVTVIDKHTGKVIAESDDATVPWLDEVLP